MEDVDFGGIEDVDFGGIEDVDMENTPTWVVALVCTVIVAISFLMERFLHFLGKYLKKIHQKHLYEALLKVKEELMLLGFISLLLVVFQNSIQSICMPANFINHMTPCKKEQRDLDDAFKASAYYVMSRERNFRFAVGSAKCAPMGKVPLMSVAAIHQLHIFVFILAITHVTMSLITMFLGSLRIQKWEPFERSTQRNSSELTSVDGIKFMTDNFQGTGRDSAIAGWLYSFVKQFYGSVTRTDYVTMRLGFIMTHCQGNQNLDFHKYMIRALEVDFKKVVGINWFLWLFVVVFMLLNVHGWNSYFWIALSPLGILLAVGTKLEHVIVQLAHDVAQNNTTIAEDLIVNPSDKHFWFQRPRLILSLIHFILFQNAFQFSYFFWIWTTYGYNSCFMGNHVFVISRIIIGICIQLLCGYSTLPLYAIVTQMGSSFKKVLVCETVAENLVGLAKKVRKKKLLKPKLIDIPLKNMHVEGPSEKHKLVKN